MQTCNYKSLCCSKDFFSCFTTLEIVLSLLSLDILLVPRTIFHIAYPPLFKIVLIFVFSLHASGITFFICRRKLQISVFTFLLALGLKAASLWQTDFIIVQHFLHLNIWKMTIYDRERKARSHWLVRIPDCYSDIQNCSPLAVYVSTPTFRTLLPLMPANFCLLKLIRSVEVIIFMSDLHRLHWLIVSSDKNKCMCCFLKAFKAHLKFIKPSPLRITFTFSYTVQNNRNFCCTNIKRIE